MAAGGTVSLKLRPDIEIIAGTREDDGSRSYLLHDPLTSTFDRIEWPEYEIVRRLARRTDLDSLHAELTRRTTLRVTRDELAHFVRDLDARGFLDDSRFQPVEKLMSEAKRADGGVLQWLLSHYLYFRVPLLRPDRFLENTLWLPRLLSGKPFTAIFRCMSAAAVYLALTRTEMFFQSVLLFLSWTNAFWLSLAVVCVKIAHEFSHAYAGKIRGARIAGMGVVFLFLFPLPYTDVTDAWRLPHRKRLAISFAGVRTELTIAVFAFVGWACSPPGVMRDMFLVFCSGSVASTLLTNLNPGMRFDGYYILADLLGVDNLRERGFGYFRRLAHRTFLGVSAPETETRLAGWRKAALVAYALYAGLYRMALYFGIAVMVYRYFPKAIGVVLFGVEIWLLLARPAFHEARVLWKMRSRIRLNLRLAITLALMAGAAGWAILPLERRLTVPATVSARRTAPLYAPWSGEIEAFRLRRGARVEAGDELFSLQTRLAQLELERVEAELAEAGYRLRLAAGGGAIRQALHKSRADERRLLAVRSALRARLDGNRLSAPFSGVVLDADERIRPGLSVSKGEYFGALYDPEAGVKLIAYVPEGDREDVRVGESGWFVPSAEPGRRIACEIESIGAINSATIAEAEIAETHGGAIPVLPSRGGAPAPAEPAYRIEAAMEGDAAKTIRLGQSGRLYLRSRPRSLAASAFKRISSILVRESGF